MLVCPVGNTNIGLFASCMQSPNNNFHILLTLYILYFIIQQPSYKHFNILLLLN